MKKLIFVYNADSGLINGIKDWAHKIVSPETYTCSLCAITYNNLGMQRPWREFIQELEFDVEFLHRDELKELHAISDISLPAVFVQQDAKLNLWINSDTMNALTSLDELQSLITKKLAFQRG